MAVTKLLTAEDLWEMEDDGRRHELMRGKLITMPPTNDDHSNLTWRIGGFLWDYHKTDSSFDGFSGDPGYILERDPDLVLAPDLAFTLNERLPEDRRRTGFSEIVPDLVIEILSPSERIGQINEKVAAYLDAGVRLIWLFNPQRRSVTVHAPDQHTRILEGDDELDGGYVLPGFRVGVDELFG